MSQNSQEEFEAWWKSEIPKISSGSIVDRVYADGFLRCWFAACAWQRQQLMEHFINQPDNSFSPKRWTKHEIYAFIRGR